MALYIIDIATGKTLVEPQPEDKEGKAIHDLTPEDLHKYQEWFRHRHRRQPVLQIVPSTDL